MAGTLYGFPFDEELFANNWQQVKDPVLTNLLESGAIVNDGAIAAQIAAGSDLYTVPFYNVIGGDPVNYDGKTDITSTETDGGSQTGVVYGRAKAWETRDFILDYHRADPMGVIISQVGNYWNKYRQQLILKVINAVFGMTKPSSDVTHDAWYKQWTEHTLDISAASSSVTAANKLGATTVAEAAQKACGDHAGDFTLAFMHSKVAQGLAGLNQLEYVKYTDPMGIERRLPLTYINGQLVVVNDALPVTGEGAEAKYTTYVLGAGSIRIADAPVERPVEADRDPKHNGGTDLLYTRVRGTILPNGVTYTKQAGDGASPTDEQLATATRYSLIHDPKLVTMARIVSNA